MTASSGEEGISIARSSVRAWPESMMQVPGVGWRVPDRKAAMSSMGFCVAESPMRWRRRPARCSSRSSDSARWLPRLSRATAWISSTITVRTPPHHLLALRARRVPGPHQRADLHIRQAQRFERTADLGERLRQILLDVVGERLERRDVHDLRAVRERALEALTQQ